MNSNSHLKIGDNICINGMELSIYQRENGFYSIQGFDFENGIDLLTEIIDFTKFPNVDFRYEELRNIRAIRYTFKNLEDIECLINVVNQMLPNMNLVLGDSFILYDSIYEVEKDAYGCYFLKNYNSRFSSHEEFLNIDIKKFIYDNIDYCIQSKYLVFKSLLDLNLSIDLIQQKIHKRVIEKKKWLKVGDIIDLGKIKFRVDHYRWSSSTLHEFHLVPFNTGFQDDYKRLNILLETTEHMFSQVVVNKKLFDWKEILVCDNLEKLTILSNVLKERIEFLNSKNEIGLSYVNLRNYNFDELKIGKATFTITEDYENIRLIYDRNKYNNNINYQSLEEIFTTIGTSSSEFSKEVLDYYKGFDNYLSFKCLSDALFFIKILQKRINKCNERRIEIRLKNNDKILALNEEILLGELIVVAIQDYHGLYMLAHKEWTQLTLIKELNKNLQIELSSFAELFLGYSEGGIFPYCRNLLHLTALVKALKEQMR